MASALASIGGALAGSVFGGGLANAISGSTSNQTSASDSWAQGGSSNSASSVSGSEGSSMSEGWSNTAGLEATANSAQEAERAHARQVELLEKAMQYNSEEARKQRKWQEDMANTVYTRSVKNMIEAGINPILAANLGLSAGNVSSGATASVGTPSSFMGQTFAEQNSAQHANSSESSFSNSQQKGSSWNNSESHSNEWANSKSGLAEGLRQMADLGEAGYNAIQSSEALKWTMDNFGDIRNRMDNSRNNRENAIEGAVEDFQDWFNNYSKDKGWQQTKDSEPHNGSDGSGGGGGHRFN